MSTPKNNDQLKAFLSLLGMSIVSALLILIIIIPGFFSSCNGMACLGSMGITLAVQWLAIIPAAIIVIRLHARRSHYNEWQPIHIVIRIGLPLVLNTLAACTMFLIISRGMNSIPIIIIFAVILFLISIQLGTFRE